MPGRSSTRSHSVCLEVIRSCRPPAVLRVRGKILAVARLLRVVGGCQGQVQGVQPRRPFLPGDGGRGRLRDRAFCRLFLHDTSTAEPGIRSRALVRREEIHGLRLYCLRAYHGFRNKGIHPAQRTFIVDSLCFLKRIYLSCWPRCWRSCSVPVLP